MTSNLSAVHDVWVLPSFWYRHAIRENCEVIVQVATQELHR